MHAYRDQYAQLFQDGQDVVLIGISTDSVDALQSWAEDDQFQFLFASDLGAVVGCGRETERRSGPFGLAGAPSAEGAS